MLTEEFAIAFREEHREIRDALLALIEAFRAHNKARITAMIGKAARLTGPHFRYEEEALYPSLVEVLGEDYIEKMLLDHDCAIGTVNALVELADKGKLSEAETRGATEAARTILPHVSDCEGLSIMTELLPDRQLQRILDRRDVCKREGLGLVQWATQVRKRPFVKIKVDAVR